MHQLPPKQYLGDHVANGLSKLGVNPCAWCTKRKKWLNDAHEHAHERFEKMMNKTSKIRPGNTWHTGRRNVPGNG